MKMFSAIPLSDIFAILFIGLFLIFNIYLMNILTGVECGYQKPDLEKSCECIGVMNEDYFATYLSGYPEYRCIGFCKNCACKKLAEGNWIEVECDKK